jgi:hypothetical protein
MSDFQTIQGVLTRTARRRRLQQAWNGLWQGFAAGAVIWLVALVTYKVAPIPSSILIGAVGLAALCVAGGFLRGWYRRPTLQQTARALDQRQQLQERLSTALELGANGGNETWRTLLVADAARFAAKIDPRRIFPYQVPNAGRWTLLVLAMAAGLGFVPEYRSKAFLEKKQDAQAVKEVGQKIVEITRRELENRHGPLDPTQKTLESVEDLGLHLDKNPLGRNDALKALASAADQVKAQMKELAQKNPAFDALKRSAHESSSRSQEGASNQKQTDAISKSLEKAGENSAALEKVASDLQKLQKAMADLPTDSSAASAAARQSAAQNLSDLAQQARQLGQPLPDLETAIADLQANHTENFQRDMDAATVDLNQLQQTAQTLQQLQQQSDKMGKDLAEQLKFGQPGVAQQTLQKMIEQLKAGQLTADQLKKRADEVSRSVDPAAPYGKAADFLQKAAQGLQKGDKASSAQSLASASKELETVLAQLDDAKALQGSLDAVNKAELCLSTHRGWCSCNHPGIGQGPGGGGVGTWTDDNSQLYPQMSQLWDNSGVKRPDMDPRGLTDRGDEKLAANLAPTKVHGQISPGSPMPSITLKGVSMKGQSAVGYREAISTAQSDAQSALNQDQVPRAYQGAVRDYFDDLKK